MPASVAAANLRRRLIALSAACAALLAVPVLAQAKGLSLTPDKMALLQQVNSHVNSTVTEVSDLELYGKADVWALPLNGKGDCEDFALLKRKMLADRGVPASAMSITVGVTPSGEAHAWLTVATSGGDYVLDNLRTSVLLTEQTGYRIFSRQGGSKGWISAGGERTTEPTADFPMAGSPPVAARRAIRRG